MERALWRRQSRIFRRMTWCRVVVGGGYKQIFCQDPKAGGGKRSQKFLRDQRGQSGTPEPKIAKEHTHLEGKSRRSLTLRDSRRGQTLWGEAAGFQVVQEYQGACNTCTHTTQGKGAAAITVTASGGHSITTCPRFSRTVSISNIM